MGRTGVASFVIALGLPWAGVAQDHPDFSGTWKMDASRSESAHQAVPIGPVTLVIIQSANEITIETKKAGQKDSAPSTETVTYNLDGTERTSRSTSGTPIRAWAHWDGTKLITETARTTQGMSFTTLYGLSLDANGQELTIDKTLTVQHGYQGQGSKSTGTGKDIFVKMRAPGKK